MPAWTPSCLSRDYPFQGDWFDLLFRDSRGPPYRRTAHGRTGDQIGPQVGFQNSLTLQQNAHAPTDTSQRLLDRLLRTVGADRQIAQPSVVNITLHEQVLGGIPDLC